MIYCSNCGTPYEVQPLRCQCGYLFGSPQGAQIAGTASGPGFFEFTGEGAPLLMLYIKVVLLSIVTLGIYSFWGRTEIRQYLWSNIRFAKQPFGYHGTGKELLLGWLKLIGVLIIVYGAAGLVYMLAGREAGLIIALIYIGGIAMIAPVAVHGAVRYRWSRTSWQGRRFSYRGELMELARIILPGILLSIVTLGLYLPIFLTNLRSYITNNTWFGGQQFQFDGVGRDVFWEYVKMVLLFLPTLGIYRFWFKATVTNYAWNHTRFAGTSMRSTLVGFDLLVLAFTNALITFFTLGLGSAWATCRTMRYLTENLQLTELPRVQLVAAGVNDADALGDAIGDVIGTDAGIDAGFGL